ncbi:hypothetical protein BC828DRAFT_399421 [Blastocladiella britannica]|nr:hypothetical protein BC828DRAFT_399421 [Blastocladiella britannica]
MHDLRKLQDEICDLKAQLAAEQERATTTESELRDRNHELTTALAESIDIRETLYKAIAEERTDNADLHDLVRDILDENDRLRAILADRGLDTDALLAQYAAPLVAPPLVDDIADSAPGQQVPPTP